jgi:catechol 2,3-dioxygenase-like lactoylglutathione lyase family enzyme
MSDHDTWPVMVPELICFDLEASRHFYVDVLGFTIKFARPESGFLYLERGPLHLMLEQQGDNWQTGALEAPLGRGVNFQMEIPDAVALSERVVAQGIALFRPLKRSWYREGEIENGQDEFLVQDPNGYLLRFMTYLGTRPASDPPQS